MNRRLRASLIAATIAAGGLLLAAVFVRVSLDWSDAQPYRGDETEARYIAFALIAVGIAATSVIVAVLFLVRSLRRPRG
ncbi:hypothetical protein SAMN05428970_3849 [Agromyces sp. CF514]|uniref:hypothetical protein n=1 Tax=Agromyces sp. CF514 TaxID=1881031 RepID=UPI0008E9C144|nr:hypothetical protein [Agromyces sp. CF514]SFR91842.1 hypothetical protein SAMN05428970_3849 [Agromyces sp. CF514]